MSDDLDLLSMVDRIPAMAVVTEIDKPIMHSSGRLYQQVTINLATIVDGRIFRQNRNSYVADPRLCGRFLFSSDDVGKVLHVVLRRGEHRAVLVDVWDSDGTSRHEARVAEYERRRCQAFTLTRRRCARLSVQGTDHCQQHAQTRRSAKELLKEAFE